MSPILGVCFTIDQPTHPYLSAETIQQRRDSKVRPKYEPPDGYRLVLQRGDSDAIMVALAVDVRPVS
jgi:hypothetical protein